MKMSVWDATLTISIALAFLGAGYMAGVLSKNRNKKEEEKDDDKQ